MLAKADVAGGVRLNPPQAASTKLLDGLMLNPEFRAKMQQLFNPDDLLLVSDRTSELHTHA